MPRVTEMLRDAQALAEFSNLEPAHLDYFRNNYPEFLPSKWWNYRDGQQWRMTQEFLRESWEKHFTGGIFFVTRLILSVFNPDDLLDSQFGFTVERRKEKGFADLGEIPWGATPFQRAVLHLFENPWRARFCRVCNKRFIAVEAKNKFCGSECSAEDRRRQKREWFRLHGKAWRKKQAQKQLRKPKGKR